jgi:phosphoribosyl-AMP cyclohydrolase
MSDPSTFTLERGLKLSPKFDAQGLICAIAQDATSLEILMVAWMSAESLALTLQTGIAHYWSRSRGEIWQKGETSGQVQTIVDIYVDCDQDALVLRVNVGGDGGACHVGFKSCFYRIVVDQDGNLSQVEDDPIA